MWLEGVNPGSGSELYGVWFLTTRCQCEDLILLRRFVAISGQAEGLLSVVRT